MPSAEDRRAQLPHPIGQVGHVGHEVAAHVWGGHHRVGAVEHRQAQQLHALLDRLRAIVQPVERVEVDLGGAYVHLTLSFGAPPEQIVTFA